MRFSRVCRDADASWEIVAGDARGWWCGGAVRARETCVDLCFI